MRTYIPSARARADDFRVSLAILAPDSRKGLSQRNKVSREKAKDQCPPLTSASICVYVCTHTYTHTHTNTNT